MFLDLIGLPGILLLVALALIAIPFLRRLLERIRGSSEFDDDRPL